MAQFQYAPAAAQIGNASTTDAGLMSASDKTKLDGVATGATANIGTVTGITMNSTAQTVDANGVVNLGTVVTDVSGKLDAPSTPGTSGQVLTSNGQGGQAWQTPSGGTVTDVQEDGTSILSSGVANILTMTGAGSSAAGTKGLVPAPAAGDQDKVLTGSGTWEVSPGAKAVVITGTITNTSGSYTTTINNDLVAAGMEMIGYELGNPSAFGAEIYVVPANGSVTISCSDVEGTSTIKIILLKVISDPTAVSSTEYTILNNRIGDLSTLTTTAKTSAVSSINEVNDHISTINGKLKFGTFEGVTLPYTTTTDGFLTIWLNPSTTSGAYARLKYSADGKNISMGLNAKSGDSVSLSYPVKKGATITQEALTNGSLALNFLPIF